MLYFVSPCTGYMFCSVLIGRKHNILRNRVMFLYFDLDISERSETEFNYIVWALLLISECTDRLTLSHFILE